MTSISLYGDYRDPQEGFAAPRFGHPKDRRTDLKQIQAGLAVTGDGGVPVFHRAYHGGAGEVAQVTAVMESLRKLAAPRTFLMVGDSKLISYPNLRAMVEAEVEFIAPASKTYVKATTLAEQHLLASTEVHHVSQHRRLVRAADQPGPRHRRRQRGVGSLQRPRSRRTPLQQHQRTPRRRPHVPEDQPAHRGPHYRRLPRASHLLPPRTRTPPGPGTRTCSPGSTRDNQPNPPAGSSSPPCPDCA
jgi:hypothetical protein